MQHVEDLNERAGELEVFQLNPLCHSGSSIRADYHVKSEALVISCATCGMGVADIPVAGKRSLAARKHRLELVATPTVVQKMDNKSRKNRNRSR